MSQCGMVMASGEDHKVRLVLAIIWQWLWHPWRSTEIRPSEVIEGVEWLLVVVSAVVFFVYIFILLL